MRFKGLKPKKRFTLPKIKQNQIYSPEKLEEIHETNFCRQKNPKLLFKATDYKETAIEKENNVNFE